MAINPVIETVIIIGAGQAGGWAAKTLRAEGFSGKLILIGAEPHSPYERPPLSKAVLAGLADFSSVQLFSSDIWQALNITEHYNLSVINIDASLQSVLLSDQTSLNYDRLIIATGGHVRRLPPHLDHKDIFYLRTLDDAHALKNAFQTHQADSSKTLLVIGGGWIGLEIAATARKIGLEVILLEAAAGLCTRTLPPVISEFLLNLHEQNGVDVRLGSSLATLDKNTNTQQDKSWQARLEDGSIIHADIVVAGIGLIPNTQLADKACLEIDNGIVVDTQGRSSNPNIFACGDVARVINKPRLESWANAQNQAIIVGKAIMGSPEQYAEIPWFWSDQYEVNLQILGLEYQDCATLIRGDLTTNQAALFFVATKKDAESQIKSEIKSVIALNCARDLKQTRSWMRKGYCPDLAALVDVKQPLNKL
ncbi:phenylpropionate dioxygenase ferredoxin reductase subunit [Gammaproteobacteria bacterium]|nr:phenylpropionate dioxygenase ferredoxin reductase subunit [Gammaproteobacteria bacterium]